MYCTVLTSPTPDPIFFFDELRLSGQVFPTMLARKKVGSVVGAAVCAAFPAAGLNQV